VARPADASKQRRVCSQPAGRLGGASAPRHIRRGPPRPTRRPRMANVSGACRAQEPVTRLPSRRGAEGDGFGLRLLAGVFVTEGFAGCDGRRGDSWTGALWDRVFARPGQTDAGWPKKVSRRVQESVTRLPSGRGAEGDGFGLRLLAGVFVTEGFAGCDGRRGDPRTCALWDRVFARPGQTDAGWPEKVSRRAQEPVTHLSSGRGA